MDEEDGCITPLEWGLDSGEVLPKEVAGMMGGVNASHPENTDDDEAARSNTNAEGDVAIIVKRLRELPFDGGCVIEIQCLS